MNLIMCKYIMYYTKGRFSPSPLPQKDKRGTHPNQHMYRAAHTFASDVGGVQCRVRGRQTSTLEHWRFAKSTGSDNWRKEGKKEMKNYVHARPDCRLLHSIPHCL